MVQLGFAQTRKHGRVQNSSVPLRDPVVCGDGHVYTVSTLAGRAGRVTGTVELWALGKISTHRGNPNRVEITGSRDPS